MLSFGILMSGVSINQVFLMFKHMGMSVISTRSFFRHQNRFLFPSVLLQWKKYSQQMTEQLKNVKDTMWSGDGRFDSMGHNAKYGVYTMFSHNISNLVHFELLQVIAISVFKWVAT